MKRLITLFFALVLTSAVVYGQTVPEILYYKFDGTGSSVPNEASSPPTGTATGTILGLSQGNTGLCGGALIGVGGSSSSNYLNTGWAPNLGNSPWTLMFWHNNIPSSTTLFYQMGDNNAGGWRVFNNGVAGPGNWWLRGPVTDVPCPGCAPVGNNPSMTTFVYDPTAGNIKAYKDDSLVNTVAQSTLSVNGSGPFKVGGYSGSTGMGSGQLMDEFRLYDRALDAQEIGLVYNACLPLTFSPNDAGIQAFVEPSNFCEDTLDIVVKLKNYGTDQLVSCNIEWTLNGVAQPTVPFSGLLDTLNGTGPQDTNITLGTRFFAANTPYDLMAWTTLPNGTADTVNYNDTSMVTVQAAIAGTFQIGGPGADYASFADAVNDLNSFGVCGPVVFNVYDSTYTEQISIGDIAGASSTNTITFQPLSGTPEVIWVAFLSNDNYTLKIGGGDWITIRGLYFRNDGTTYGRVMDIGGESHNNTFEDCWFVGDTTPTTTSTFHALVYSSGDVDTNNVFRNNTLRGGSYASWYYGSGTTSLETGTVFEGNTMIDNYYMGLRFQYQDACIVTDNHFVGNTNYTGSVYRYYFFNCDNDILIANNTATGDYYGYGIYMSSCDGNANARGQIYNNMLRIGNSVTTSTSYGIYLTNCGFQDVYHNSVNVTSNSNFSRACYVTSGGGNTLTNNIFVNQGPGYALYVQSNYSLSNSDYNDLYAPNGNVGYFASSNQATLNDWQTASSFDANSVSVDPLFYTDDDLHVCQDTLNGAAQEGWAITDIDGQVRDLLTPDIGADEFTPISSFTLGPDTAICTGQTLILSSGAAPSDTVLWSTGATTPEITVTTAGNYSVSVNGACGSASDAITVTNANVTYSNFLVSDTNDVCDGDTVTLSSTMMGGSYSWTGGSTGSTLQVTTSGTYDLTITDSCGSGTESITINFNSAPLASFTSTSSFLTGIFTFTGTATGNTTFDWDFGDATGTSTLQDPIYLYGADGSYVVSLTVTNECGSNTFSDTIVINTVGMEEELLNQAVGIYPNPSNGTFNVDLNLAGANDFQISVLDLQGRELFATDQETVYGKTVKELTLENFTAGLYFVKIEVNGHSVMKKLVIE